MLKKISRFKFTSVMALFLILLLFSGTLLAEEFYETKDFDLEGETVTIHFSHDVLSGQHGPPHVPERVEAAEEKFNVNIETKVVPIEEKMESRANRLMAGDSEYDIWRIDNVNLWSMVAEDMILPISEYVPESYYENLPQIPRKSHKYNEINGVKYTFSNRPDIENHAVIAFNKDIYDKTNLENPQKLYEKGEWTWDTFEKHAIELTQDTSGDGEIDQWGIAFTNPYWWVMANGGNLTKVKEDGSRSFGMNEPQALTALEKLQEWHDVEGIVGGDFEEGTAAMTEFWVFTLELESNIDNYGLVPYPQGPDVEENKYPADSVSSYVLPMNSAEPEAMVAIMSYLMPNQLYGARNQSLINRAPDRKSAQILEEIDDQWDGSEQLGAFYIGEPVWDSIFEEVLTGEQSPNAVMDALEPEANALLEELYWEE
ncbi:MAG: ABC transporter substrate-binding protein [Halanaerobiaceae bacterium]